MEYDSYIDVVKDVVSKLGRNLNNWIIDLSEVWKISILAYTLYTNSWYIIPKRIFKYINGVEPDLILTIF